MRLSKVLQRLQDMQKEIQKECGQDFDPHVVNASNDELSGADLEIAGFELRYIQRHDTAKDDDYGPFVYSHPNEGEKRCENDVVATIQ